jgi:hypothetical protein
MKHHNHREHYTPEPMAKDEPSQFAVIGGAFVFAALMYLLTFLVFCL